MLDPNGSKIASFAKGANIERSEQQGFDRAINLTFRKIIAVFCYVRLSLLLLAAIASCYEGIYIFITLYFLSNCCDMISRYVIHTYLIFFFIETLWILLSLILINVA